VTGRTGFAADRGPEPVGQPLIERRGQRQAHREGGRVAGYPDAVAPVGEAQRGQPEVGHRGEVAARERDLVVRAHLRDDVGGPVGVTHYWLS